MRLVDLVRIDHRFEKSVNLLLDLNDESKLKLYIPTRSSIKLLTEYLEEVDTFSGKRANILIGPYGKGKSHLLLVLLAILSGNHTEELECLFERIGTMDGGAKAEIEKVYKKKKLLPVIINTSSGNLSQIFAKSLNQALKREGFTDVVPDNYFSKALFTISQWEKHYPDTYDAFKKAFHNQQENIVNGLEAYDYEALAKFKNVYPALTSGSEFNPDVEEDVLSVYQSVNKRLCKNHGYDGIYVVFDEFSKYIEGHTTEGFSADMKTLQDLCELCNSSKEEQLHLTCVAHKAIRSYGDVLSKEVKNAFLGVEGRLNEKKFIVSSQNNYELIADAIQKTPEFAGWSRDDETYQEMLDRSYQIKEFRSLFDKDDYDSIVGNGAFPLTPLSACLLLQLSEKIAQNERTLFTFLTSKDLYSLAAYVEQCPDTAFAGAPLIYDYFSQLLADEKDFAVHGEWINAEHAIDKAEDADAKSILKTMAVIRMVNLSDDIPVNEEYLYLATGLGKEKIENAIEILTKQNLIAFNKEAKTYSFHGSVSVNLQELISDDIKKQFTKINVPDVLNRVNKNKYVLPKKYNQDHCMTRYFQVHIINSDSFMALSSMDYLPKEKHPDGYLFLVLNQHKEKPENIRKHLEELNDRSVMAAIVEQMPHVKSKAQNLLAVQKLLNDKTFSKENEAAGIELENWKKTLLNDLNRAIEDAMEHISTLYTRDGSEKIKEKPLNRVISDVAEAVYNKTPLINNESINRHNVTAQYSKARNVILDDIFHSRMFEQYNSGTSAEATIYRACIGSTKNDSNLAVARNEIIAFIHKSKGQKVAFATLVDKLTGAPYGMRRGVLPIYIAEQLMQLEDMPVIYHDKTEIALSPKLIVDAVAAPDNHYLYVEAETVEKLEYIEGLEKLFSDYGEYCNEIENMNRLARLKCFIQAWYRSLPQTATTFQVGDYPRQDMRKLKRFRKALTGEPNPRELIFEQIPDIFEECILSKTLKKVEDAKKDIDAHTRRLKKQAEGVVKRSLSLPHSDDLQQSLKVWYENIPPKAKNSLLPATSQSLLNCIRDVVDGKSIDLIEKLAKTATNFFIEDWNDKTKDEFESVLKTLVSDLKKKEDAVNAQQSKKIMLPAEEGTKEYFYDFNPNELSPSGVFFQSALDDMVDEYEALDNSEKIGILMNLVKKLMG